jgi:hypothetical protein
MIKYLEVRALPICRELTENKIKINNLPLAPWSTYNLTRGKWSALKLAT